MRILIADDDTDSRVLLRRVLRAAGHVVEGAENGSEALERARATAPDLVIADILMPVMDGFKLCSEVKADPKLRSVPFVFYTATYLEPEDECLGLGLGACRYISKPQEPEEFLRLIGEVVEEAARRKLEVCEPAVEEAEALHQLYDEAMVRKLRRRERQLKAMRSLFESGDDAVCVLSQDGVVLQASPAVSGLLGLPEAETRGVTFSAYLPEQCAAELVAACDEGRARLDGVTLEAADGRSRIVDMTFAPVFDEDGEIEERILVLRDVTKARRAEAEMRRFRKIVDLSNDGIFVSDAATGAFLDVNQRACKRLGFSRDEILAMGIQDLDPDHPDPETYGEILGHIREKGSVLFETHHRTRDGEVFPVEVGVAYDPEEDVLVSIARDISERVEARSNLEEQERYFRTMMYGLHEDILVVDRDYRITDINNTALATTGQERSEVIGRTCYEVSHGHNAPCSEMGEACALMEVFATGEGRICHHIHRAADGSEMHVDIALSPLADAEGRVTHVVEAARDVTAMVEADAELKAREARLRHTFERNLAGMYRSTVDGRMLECNQAFAEIFGHSSPEDILSGGALALYEEPATRERLLAELERVGHVTAWEQPMRHRDGSRVWVLLSASLVENGAGGQRILEGSFIDVTERKVAEGALRESEERLRSIVENSTNLFYSHGIDHVLTYVSPQSRRILGCEPEEALRSWTDFATDSPVNRRAVENTQRAIDSGEPQPPYQLELQNRNGKRVWVEVREAPVVRDGKVVAIVGALADITEERRLEEQLAQAQKLEAIGQLAGGIAHDFNNLLTAISGSADLLGMQVPQLNEDSQELGTIRETVKRGAELTRRLLAIARQQVLNMEALDLSLVVADEVKILRRVIPENIEMEFSPFAGLPAVRVDRSQLAQVLMNLAVNARDSMPEGGRILIEIEPAEWPPGVGGEVFEREGPCVRLSVSDNGAGMDTDTLVRIFEPFFSTKAPEEGTGLGLATVYGIVRQHGGVIVVDSVLGEGTRFEVSLPIADKAIGDVQEVEDSHMVGGVERVLVVEDDVIVRNAVVRILRGLGYEVAEAEDGMEAMAVLEGSAGFDLVLSDVVMPRMGGKELLERARMIVPDLRFLFLSGYTEEGLRETLGTAKRASFIAKPFRASALALAVRDALQDEEQTQ